jgi:WD40 repeat protein
MLQDPVGIYVMLRQPLRLLGFLNAPNSYQARFSEDGESISVVSMNLLYERWDVRTGRKLESKDLPIRGGCVSAKLSPNGGLFACYQPNFSVSVMRLPTTQWIVSERLRAAPQFPLVPVSLDLNTAFPGPFGFVLARDMEPLVNRGFQLLQMVFSPDSKTLLAADLHDALREDLESTKKAGLPGAIHKQLDANLTMLDDKRVLVVGGKERAHRPAIFSVDKGEVLASPAFDADAALLATNKRYSLLISAGSGALRLFDLEGNRLVDTPSNIALDVFADECAVASESGDLSLYHVAEAKPFATLHLPLDALPRLRTASVSPNLDKLAFEVDEAGGLFQSSNGLPLMSLSRFFALDFADNKTAFLLTSAGRPELGQQSVYAVDLDNLHDTPETSASGSLGSSVPVATPSNDWLTKETPRWTGNKDLRSGGAVFLEYSFSEPMGTGFLVPEHGSVIPYRLRALDPSSGKQLWIRSFDLDAPVPFADPQGDRLVLGWKAKSSEPLAVAKRHDALKELLKRTKLTDHDSFFEVLDGRTGKSLGGALVQTGAGPENFECVFSVGPAIVLSRGDRRVYVYSIEDGQSRARLLGIRPTASSASDLLALEESPGHLVVYDLLHGDKLDEQNFTAGIAYSHFSVDGQHLLVLTEDQTVFILDMRDLRKPKP